MEALNIHTVSMSRIIHVDASLVSKWKTGNRTLNVVNLRKNKKIVKKT